MQLSSSIALAWAAIHLLLLIGAAEAQPVSVEERKLVMRQITQQLQARLEQRLRCINQAKTISDLDTCQRTNSTGWHHGPGMGGPGMGGWGCPIW
jgi:hypothetical protein